MSIKSSSSTKDNNSQYSQESQEEMWFKNAKKSILTYEDEETDISRSNKGGSSAFIEMVMNNTYLPEQAKIDFSEFFLRRYLSDNKYKTKVQNSYIVFINKQYYGIIKNIEDTYNIGPDGTSRYAFQITDKHESLLSKHEI
jgi:hypothetical protein